MWLRVYLNMLVQVCKSYPGLPDVKTLKASEIKLFYDAQAPELEAALNG